MDVSLWAIQSTDGLGRWIYRISVKEEIKDSITEVTRKSVDSIFKLRKNRGDNGDYVEYEFKYLREDRENLGEE